MQVSDCVCKTDASAPSFESEDNAKKVGTKRNPCSESGIGHGSYIQFMEVAMTTVLEIAPASSIFHFRNKRDNTFKQSSTVLIKSIP